MEDLSADDAILDHAVIDRRRFRVPSGGIDAEDLSQITNLCRQQWALGRIGTIPIVPPVGEDAAAEVEVEVQVEIHIRPRSR